ncbi:hypothetical protein JCM11641_007231 [Rhodosporidiobolus odoratus]
MHAATFLSALLSFAAVASASSHRNSPLEYHAHTSFLRNGTALAKRATTCPSLSSKGMIIAEYVPAWTSNANAGVDWGTVDMAFWFCALTSSTGLALAPGTTTAGMVDFATRANNAGKKPLITIGGWSGSVYFSDLVSTAAKRTNFANTVRSWIVDYKFAGVDIDWEFVGRQGAGNNIVSSSDAANYVLFLQTLRATLGNDMLITAAVPAAGINGADGSIMTDVSEFAKWFDYIELMAYDFYGSWSGTTGPDAPLYTCNAGSDSVDATIARWTKAGFPACKLILGIPAYSHNFQTATSTISSSTYNGVKTSSFQAISSSAADQGLSITGLVSAGYLSSDLTKGAGGFTRYWDDCTKTPFLFNPSTKAMYMYDDDESWGAKAALAKTKGLAGVVIYESTGFPAPMLAAAAKALAGGTSSSSSAAASTSTTSSRTSTSAAPGATKTCSASNDCAGQSIPAHANNFCKSGVCTWRCQSAYTQSGSSCIFPGSSTSSSTITTSVRTNTTVAPSTTTSALPATRTCSASNDCAGQTLPAHANNYCKSGVCSYRCQSGFTAVGSQCVSTASTTSSVRSTSTSSSARTTTTSAPPATQTCAASSDCKNTPPANANRYCNKGTCSFRCKSGYTLSGSSTCVKTAARRLARARRAHAFEEDYAVGGEEFELFRAETAGLAADQDLWSEEAQIDPEALLD